MLPQFGAWAGYVFRGASVLEIHPLYTVADARQHLVWNGVKTVGKHRHGQMVAENLHRVTFPAVNVCHVNHRHVHADIAHIGRTLAVHQTIAATAAQMAVQSLVSTPFRL